MSAKRYSHEVKAQVLSMMENGTSNAEIRRTFGMSATTISLLAEKYNVRRVLRNRKPTHSNEFIHSLRDRRVAFGINKTKMAKMIGLSTESRHLNDLEHNLVNPNFATLEAWVNALGGELEVKWVRAPKEWRRVK